MLFRPSRIPVWRTPKPGLEQNDIGCIARDIDCAVDGDAYIGRVERRRIVDPVAQVADHVPAMLEGEDYSVLLCRRDAREYRLSLPLHVATRFQSFARFRRPKLLQKIDADLFANMASHEFVITGYYFELNAVLPECGDGSSLCLARGGSANVRYPASTSSDSSFAEYISRLSMSAIGDREDPIPPAAQFLERLEARRPPLRGRNVCPADSYAEHCLITDSGAPLVIREFLPLRLTTIETRRRSKSKGISSHFV